MRFPVLILILASLCPACGDDTPTTPSSTASGRATERFDDIINVRESKFFAFSVGSNGTTSINLASLSPISRPGVIVATVEIGWGKTAKDDAGTVIGCTLSKVTQTAPSLSAQINDTLAPASDYCANIADVDPATGLREPANFSIRITHP
ncbi:MAG TPA: hypothetical protein VN654_00560 [Vicinamibacterales bacterium]|jgi:hypothetical protein|nr:hypothetical protein [Vicinamibacterales bacterium]